MMRVAETGHYLDTIVVMLAAEWTYATWCERANQQPSTDALLAEWVRLHAGPEFSDQADWLMRMVDAAGTNADAARFAHLAQLFGEALRLEIDFHSAAYQDYEP